MQYSTIASHPITRSSIRRSIGLAAGAAMLALSLAACGGAAGSGEAPEAGGRPPAASDGGGEGGADATTRPEGEGSGGADEAPDSDDGGAGSGEPDQPIATDDGDEESEYGESDGEYLFLPVPGNAAELPAEDVEQAVAGWFEFDGAEVECGSGLELGDQMVCQGSVDDPQWKYSTTSWDVALVRTAGDGTALVVRSARTDAGEGLPLVEDARYQGAYMADEGETGEQQTAAALEESFGATSGTEEPVPVDVDITCTKVGGEHDTTVCDVAGDVPEGAAGRWHGTFHPGFLEGSSQVVFSKAGS